MQAIPHFPECLPLLVDGECEGRGGTTVKLRVQEGTPTAHLSVRPGPWGAGGHGVQPQLWGSREEMPPPEPLAVTDGKNLFLPEHLCT